MPIEILINQATGVPPYSIYLCSAPEGTPCILVYSNIYTVPFYFLIPNEYNIYDTFVFKIFDSNNCEIDVIPFPSPTPTVTPTHTVTPTQTNCDFDVYISVGRITPTPTRTPIILDGVCNETKSVSPVKGGSWLINDIKLTHDWIGSVTTHTSTKQGFLYDSTTDLYMFPGIVVSLGTFGSFIYYLYFDKPINYVKILYAGAGWYFNSESYENFIFTTDAGTPIIIPLYTTLTTINGNEIITGKNSNWNENITGTGNIIIYGTSSFTMLKIEGVGAIGGTLFKFCVGT